MADQDSDDDSWVHIDSDNPADSSGDDAGVLALSSGGTTPNYLSDQDDILDVVLALSSSTRLPRRCARSPSPDDADAGVLALSSTCTTSNLLSDHDDSLGVAIPLSSFTRCARSPSPPSSPDDDEEEDDDVEALMNGLAAGVEFDDDNKVTALESRPLSGLFHNTLDEGVGYFAFDPVLWSNDRKVLIPDPAFSSCNENFTVLASNGGLVCLLARKAGVYVIANPATYKRVFLPRHSCNHRAYGDPAVVITFEESYCCADHRGHYHVVVAFPLQDGIYAYESFSSRTWKWTAGDGISDVEHVVASSGVAALGRAFWRTALGYILCYDPKSGRADFIPAAPEVLQWPSWELGEMNGTLAVTCMDERVNQVLVSKLHWRLEYGDDGALDHDSIKWSLAAHSEGGCMWNRQDVYLLRSQGHEVVLWSRLLEIVAAMDVEGRTTRTIGPLSGQQYYSDFIPYVASTTGITSIEAGAYCSDADEA